MVHDMFMNYENGIDCSVLSASILFKGICVTLPAPQEINIFSVVGYFNHRTYSCYLLFFQYHHMVSPMWVFIFKTINSFTPNPSREPPQATCLSCIIFCLIGGRVDKTAARRSLNFNLSFLLIHPMTGLNAQGNLYTLFCSI